MKTNKLLFLLVVLIYTQTYSQYIYPELIGDLDEKLFAPNEFVNQKYFDLNSKVQQVSIIESNYKNLGEEGFSYRMKKIYTFNNQKIKSYETKGVSFPYKIIYQYENEKITKITNTSSYETIEYSYKYHDQKGFVNEVEVKFKETTETAFTKVKDSIVTLDEFDNNKKKIASRKHTFKQDKLITIETQVLGEYTSYALTKLNYNNNRLEQLSFEKSNTGNYTGKPKFTATFAYNDKGLKNRFIYNSKTTHFSIAFTYLYDVFGNWIARFEMEFDADNKVFKLSDLSLRQYSYLNMTTGYSEVNDIELLDEITEKISQAKSLKELENYFQSINNKKIVDNKATFLSLEKDLKRFIKKTNFKKGGKLTLGNDKNGFGEITYPDSTYFKGGFKNGKRQGVGVMTDKYNSICVIKYDSIYADKYEFIYISNNIEEFVGNQISKKGFYYNKIANKFYDIRLNDQGNIATKTIVDVHKTINRNCILGDCQNGFGSNSIEENNYFGNFLDGRKDGYGIQKSIYGNRGYFGQFKNNKPNGVGLMFSSKRDYYAGEFINEEPNGLGFTYIGKENYYGYGIWKNGEIDDLIQTNIPKDKL